MSRWIYTEYACFRIVGKIYSHIVLLECKASIIGGYDEKYLL